MSFFTSVFFSASILLQLVLLWFLIRSSSVKRYWVFFAYSITHLATTLAEMLAFYGPGPRSAVYRQVYWTDQVILNLLLFILVIVLAYSAIESEVFRKAAGKAFTFIIAIALVLPFILFRDRELFGSRWFDGTSQLLTFGVAIMNLVLWTALLGSKRRDPRILTLSIGLGVGMAGEAMAWGGHQLLSPERQWLPDAFGTVTHVLNLLIWCRAFRPRNEVPAPHAAPVPSTSGD